MNSTTNALRQTFMTKIPTQEDIDRTCNDLAEKLAMNEASKNDVKIALVDVLEEALQGTVFLEDLIGPLIITWSCEIRNV